MGTTNPSIQDVLDAIGKINSNLDEFKLESNTHYNALSSDIQEIKNRTTSIDDRLNVCESNVDHLTYEVEILKQRQLQNNISISGIPIEPNENLHDIFDNICKAINYVCPHDMIASIYRTNGSAKRSIIVCFINDSVKFGMLAAKKNKQTILLVELGFKNSKAEVMLNQQLTPYFGNLLYTARQARHKGDITQCWFTNKGVYIKPNANSNSVLIKCQADLLPFSTNSSEKTHKRKPSNELQNSPKKTNDTQSSSQIQNRNKGNKNNQQANNNKSNNKVAKSN